MVITMKSKPKKYNKKLMDKIITQKTKGKAKDV